MPVVRVSDEVIATVIDAAAKAIEIGSRRALRPNQQFSIKIIKQDCRIVDQPP
jgi:hypothetical protein